MDFLVSSKSYTKADTAQIGVVFVQRRAKFLVVNFRMVPAK